VRASIGLPITEATTAADIATCARAAEQHGYESVFVTDHPAPTLDWLRSGGHDTLDPFVALSFAAAATTTIGLHTNLLVLPYRSAAVTAKSVATLDALSDGRVIIGVGVGYLEAEFDAVGADYARRGDIAEQTLVALRAALTGEPQPPHGTVTRPRPARQPRPPIWVGGNSLAAIRRAVTYGDGWAPMPSPQAAERLLGTPPLDSIAALARRIEHLHELLAARPRSEQFDIIAIPSSLSGFTASAPPVAELVDEVAALRAAGATALAITLPTLDVGEWAEQAERLHVEVLRWVR
jgi:probable F420-dependent oxidoreductase